jgi:hypothetical protein
MPEGSNDDDSEKSIADVEGYAQYLALIQRIRDDGRTISKLRQTASITTMQNQPISEGIKEALARHVSPGVELSKHRLGETVRTLRDVARARWPVVQSRDCTDADRER